MSRAGLRMGNRGIADVLVKGYQPRGPSYRQKLASQRRYICCHHGNDRESSAHLFGLHGRWSAQRDRKVMQRIEIHLEDDLTGGPADETVTFAVDGKGYEVDLSTRHAADFRRQLARFVEHARPARSRRRSTSTRTTVSRERSRAIRSWADKHGHAVADRGRLPRSAIEEYEAAHRAIRREPRSSGRGTAGRRAAEKPKRTARLSTRRRSGH